MKQRIGNIKGDIYSFVDGKIVIQTRNGFVHMLIGEDITELQIDALKQSIGKARSLWARKDDQGRLHLLPDNANAPTAPDLYRRRA